MPFETVNGRERFKNDCVNIWRCPKCKTWRQVTETHCALDKTPRDAEQQPSPEMLRD